MMRCFLFSLVLCCGLRSVSGQVSLDDAVRIALERHPELKVARSEVAIAQARLIDAGKLENPVFQFSLESQLADGSDREGSIFMGYSQKFPVTGKLLLQRDLGIADIKLACAEIREVEREFVGDVQKFYIDAVGARARIEVLQQLEDDADEYIRLAKAQLQIALGSELDVNAAETEKLLATQSRSQAECDYREALAGLRPMLGMSANEGLILSQSLHSVTTTLRNSVQLTVPETVDRADVVAAGVRQERACAREALARAEGVEDWEIEGGYTAARTVDEPVGVERERFLGIGLKIPLPVRKKGQGIIAEARAEKEKACLELDAVEAKAKAEIAIGIEALCRSNESMETLENKVLPQLKIREKKTRDAYQQGLVNFNQVVLLQQQQSRISEALVEARSEQAHRLAKLQMALGTHPRLQSYCPAACPIYQPGTEPKNAPFALPTLQAYPVEHEVPAPRTGKSPFKNLVNKLRAQ